jgi:hypothetical protein
MDTVERSFRQLAMVFAVGLQAWAMMRITPTSGFAFPAGDEGRGR